MKKYFLWGIGLLVGAFVLALFVAPLLHPDHRVTKVGIVTDVAASGDPYFRQTDYTLTFRDGDVIRVHAARSVPIPVNKPVAIIYSSRGRDLLGVEPAGR